MATADMKWSPDWTLSELKKLKRWLIRKGELPVRGVHCGGGRHVAMPETWDGFGSRPPGFAEFVAPVVKHQTDSDNYAIGITPWLKDAWRRHKDTLSQAKQDAVQAKIDAFVDVLPAGWFDADGRLTRFMPSVEASDPEI